MMRLYSKKKVEVFIETPASRLVIDALSAAGSRGHTVMPTLSGRGQGGAWDSIPFTQAQSHVLVVTVVGDEVLERILASVGKLLEDFHGIITVSTVEVLRSERF